MSAPSRHGLAREALLFAARSQHTGGERKCHALLELMEACHTLAGTLRSELAGNSFTENGFRVLAHVIHREPDCVAPAVLAEELDISRQCISRVLGRLEVSGLITRQRDKDEPRVFSVKATPRGVSSFKHAVRCLLGAIDRLMSILDSSDIATLDRACALLRASSSRPRSS